jgi:DNA invertase Pin-like site-specific DNA recombinase
MDTTKRAGRTQVRAARAIGYVRVSRVGGRGGESFISPELQRETIAAKAQAGGLEVVELVEDMDESGGKFDRPGFARALEAVERGEVSVIVVARLSRFARSVLDTHRALERIEAAGGRLVACDIDVDVSTPQGRLIRNVFATLAQFELELAEEQWSAAKANAVGRGVKIASRAPFGYRFDAEHRLEPSEDAGTLVELFRRRAAGKSWRTLVAWFAGETGRTVAPATLVHMIRNRAYLGEVSYGELLNTDAHVAIVEPELYEAAQRPSADWKAGRPTRASGARTLLAGIARCASCGGGMTSTIGGRGKRVYRCSSLQCTRRVAILQAGLDELVERELLAWTAPVADELVDVELGESDRAAERRAELVQRRLDAELGLETFVTSELGLEPAIFAAGVRARQEAIAALEAELEQLGEAGELERVRTTLRASWPVLPLDDRRRLLAVCVAELVVDRGVRGDADLSKRVRLAFGEPGKRGSELAH